MHALLSASTCGFHAYLLTARKEFEQVSLFSLEHFLLFRNIRHLSQKELLDTYASLN